MTLPLVDLIFDNDDACNRNRPDLCAQHYAFPCDVRVMGKPLPVRSAEEGQTILATLARRARDTGVAEVHTEVLAVDESSETTGTVRSRKTMLDAQGWSIGIVEATYDMRRMHGVWRIAALDVTRCTLGCKERACKPIGELVPA